VPAAGDFVETGASIGVVLLLLTLGLEFDTTELTHSPRRHVPPALVDLVLNATPGLIAGWLLGLPWPGVLALAGATWVSSSGSISRLLGDLRRLGNRETPAILSVLVMEDFAMADPPAGARGAGLRRQLPAGLLGVVAALAELVPVSASVGAFLVGLTLTGATAEQTRAVPTPARPVRRGVLPRHRLRRQPGRTAPGAARRTRRGGRRHEDRHRLVRRTTASLHAAACAQAPR
jgi:CPA2 family monovalent cation:H+ antiporter-2